MVRCFKQISVAVLLVALAGCASNPTVLLDATAGLFDAGSGEENILFATVRAPSVDGRLVFGGDRANDISYGSVSVRIPPDREIGKISYPKNRIDPRRDFSARSLSPLGTSDALKASVEARLANLPATEQEVSVFVHGYNTDFAEGIFLSAQMVHDFGAPGVPVHFSWASAGIPQGYLYDLESANIARDDLAVTIRDLQSTSATDLILVAHSMGGMVLMEALRQIGLEGDTSTLSEISAVVLAAPDIDIDVFEEQLRALNPRPFPIMVFVSRGDPALQISSRLRGRQPRVGDGSSVNRLRALGVGVVDLTDVSSSRREEHNKFANSPFVINMIRQASALRHSLDTTPDDAIQLFDTVADSGVAVAAPEN
ncbi:MAG: alpha/beta fold hydrolase [Pseudomonadota bacterium]